MDSQGSETPFVVLLVEDQALVRMMGADILEEAGFQVVEATNADEALQLLEAREDVRVLFTDVDMPGSLNGIELAHVTSERWPNVGVLIVSGKMRPGPGELPPRGVFISKPYQPASLVGKIREMARRAA